MRNNLGSQQRQGASRLRIVPVEGFTGRDVRRNIGARSGIASASIGVMPITISITLESSSRPKTINSTGRIASGGSSSTNEESEPDRPRSIDSPSPARATPAHRPRGNPMRGAGIALLVVGFVAGIRICQSATDAIGMGLNLDVRHVSFAALRKFVEPPVVKADGLAAGKGVTVAETFDEAEAALDESNVDRFCNLVRDIAGETKTRFLIITHHRVTMARMDRLYGVTMAEQGVSQLVSVDLETAERLREAV